MLRSFVLCIASLTPIAPHADAVTDLKAKADKGDAEAMFQLGRLYADGKDVKKDEAEALKWYRKAAAKDHTKAEVQLGSFYAHGFGVKQDWAESIRWYRKAALKGDTTAQHNLGLDYLHGHGVQKDAEMARHWFFLAAIQGHARAQFNLAELYETGEIVSKSKPVAYVWYLLASRHPEQVRIFGEAKAKELIERRDQVEKLPSVVHWVKWKEADTAAFIAVQPRRFGSSSGIGSTRGWYIWRKWDSEQSKAEMMHEETGEVFETTVLPWTTTYRYLNYGGSPKALLTGERINAFFSSNENHKRGYLVHFQDEIGQMKGHGHFWQIKTVGKDGASFSAVAIAGEKPIDGKELVFHTDSKCRVYKAGKSSDKFPFAAGDKVYLTWCSEKDRRIAKLACDDASLETIRKTEGERLQKEINRDGMAGRIESWDGDKLHVMIYARNWAQAGQLRDQQSVVLKMEDEILEAKIAFRKNRGDYGSGVTDMLIEPTKPVDAKRIRLLVLTTQEIHIIPKP